MIASANHCKYDESADHMLLNVNICKLLTFHNQSMLEILDQPLLARYYMLLKLFGCEVNVVKQLSFINIMKNIDF